MQDQIKTQPLSSLQNALRILRSFSMEKPIQGVTEMAHSLNMKKSTVHRLVATLAYEGFLVKEPETQKYQLGLSALALSGIVTSNMEIYNEALPVVHRLVDKVDETAHIAISDGPDVIYIMKVECKHHVSFLTHVGRRNPLHCTSSGKVLLAHKNADFIHNYFENVSKSESAFNPVKLQRSLEEIRERGYAASYEELMEGVHSVAAPIRDYRGKVIAAVTVVGPKKRMTRCKTALLAKQVMEAGNEISKQIGYFKPHL